MWHYSSFLIRVMNRPALLSAFWLCASTLGVQAQTTRPEIIAQPPTAASATTRPQLVPDEPLLYTYALTPEKSEPAADTLPDANFRMYNPARRPLIDYGTTGNLGSSARPMLYEVRPQRGFDFGIPLSCIHCDRRICVFTAIPARLVMLFSRKGATTWRRW
jgi:hypothetical protein